MRSKFAYNDAVIITEPIDISSCDTIIEKGDRGRVIDVDPDNGDVTIRVCGYRPDLHCRSNCIYLSAREAACKIKLASSRALTFKTAAKLIGTTAAICAALTILANRESDNASITLLMSALHNYPATGTVTSLGCQPHGGYNIGIPTPRQSDSIYNAKFDAVAAVNDLIRTSAH